MNDLHAAVARAEAKLVALRAANARSRHRLTPAGQRRAAGVWVLRVAVVGLAAGLVAGHLRAVERREEDIRVETAFHRERMYSKHYLRESCEGRRRELSEQTLSCQQARAE